MKILAFSKLKRSHKDEQFSKIEESIAKELNNIHLKVVKALRRYSRTGFREEDYAYIGTVLAELDTDIKNLASDLESDARL